MRILDLAKGAFALLQLSFVVSATPISALAAQQLSAGQDRVLKSRDEFYREPADLATMKPGMVVNSRPINASFFGNVPDPVQAWQLLYTTTAINGTIITSTTTVFKPTNAKLDRFVSYATAYDAANPACDPSLAYQQGSRVNGELGTDIEFLIIEGYLLQGYIVASPDYEGPDAAFTAGHLEGMGVLDNMRAVSNFATTLGLTTKTPAIFGQGYSGGALATGWAASLQRTYAPELPMKGWSIGGTPANLTGLLLFLDNTQYSGYLPDALAGLMMPSAYKSQLQPLFSKILTVQGQQAISYVQNHCTMDDIKQYSNISILSTQFQTLGPSLLQQPAFANVLAQSTMGITNAQTPTAPVFMYHAKNDQIVSYAYATELAQRWCSNGANVTFTTFNVGGHLAGAIDGVPRAYLYANSAFADTVKPGCTNSTSSATTLDPTGLATALKPIISQLGTILKNLAPGE